MTQGCHCTQVNKLLHAAHTHSMQLTHLVHAAEVQEVAGKSVTAVHSFLMGRVCSV